MPIHCQSQSSIVAKSKHLPKLALPPRNPVNPHTLRVPERKANRSPSHITPILIRIIPFLAISMKQRLSVAQDGEVFATEAEGCTALGICDAHAIAHPVLDVVAPGELAADGNVAVLQVKDVHYFGDGVVTGGYFDLSVLPALLEGVHDRGAVIL
jgi:hypothetical protein